MPRPRTRDAELAARFVDSAVAIVRADGAGALTTRRVSDAAGSNIAALNQLFGNRDGLVDAVMADGFRRLADAAARSSDGLRGRERLRVYAAAYRRFARQSPTLVEVMFARPVSASAAVDLSGAVACRRLVVDAVREILPEAAPELVTASALGFGALVEGLAMNERRGLLGSPDAADRTWTVAVDAVLVGLVG